MSAATADVTDAAAAPPKAGSKKKKLIIIVAAAVLVLAVAGGGGAYYMIKKKAAAAAEAEGEDGAGAKAAADAHGEDKLHAKPPVFLPLDPFTVNLGDREADRYAQIGVSFEVEDAKTADLIKNYMPAIRNNILLLLARKTSAELLTPEGKLALARELKRESLRPLGINMPADAAAAAGHGAAASAPGKNKAAPKPEIEYPIRAVHFSNIIIQ